MRAALPEIMARKGYVLIVSSAAAGMHMPLMSAYTASKAGVEAFADSLRFEMLPFGVDVGCAYYNWIATDMVKSADAHTVGGYMRSKLPYPMGKTYPETDATSAMVKGIVGRKKYVMAPGWLHVALPSRWLLAKLPKVVMRPMVAKANAMLEEEFKTRGVEATSAPVGVAGAAAVASKQSRAVGAKK